MIQGVDVAAHTVWRVFGGPSVVTDRKIMQALTELFAASTLQQPEDAIGFLLWRVSHRYQREMDRAFAGIDLTHLQFVTLAGTAWMSRTGEPLTQPGLAAFSNIHPMQLSSVLKALEKKGLVARRRNTTDTRVKIVAISDAGIAMLFQALPLVTRLQQRFFGHGEEVASRLHTLLRQVVAGWDEER